MYRFFTFRLDNPPLPVTRYTKQHPEVRAIAYTASREDDTPLPTENYYVVRAPARLHAEIDALFHQHLEVKRRIESPEPGVLIYHCRFRFPDKGPVRGFLAVLADAVGTILEFRPIIMENGALTVSMLSLPRSDSVLRIRALEAYAADTGLGFKMVENRPVPTLPIAIPRQVTLDLMEWQVVQALDGAGVYTVAPQSDPYLLDEEDEAPPEPDAPDVDAIIADLADALGLTPTEVGRLRRRAEKKVLHEFSQVHKRNVELATPPARAPDDAS